MASENQPSPAQTAVNELLIARCGERVGVLQHSELGAIDLVYGDEKHGLAHIARKHPEVLPILGDLAARMPVNRARSTSGRIVLEDMTHKAVMSTDLHGVPKLWLVTAYEKKDKG